MASSSEMSSLYLRNMSSTQHTTTRMQAHLFSRKVLALTMFLPIADAFHAQNAPDGSTW